jgi:hypothetical protein
MQLLRNDKMAIKELGIMNWQNKALMCDTFLKMFSSFQVIKYDHDS